MNRRIRVILTSLLCAALVFGLCACDMFSGCDDEEVTETTKEVVIDTFGKATNGIYLHSDLTLTDVLIEEFDMSKYDANELLSLWQQEIDEYNATYAYIEPTTAVPSTEAVSTSEGETVPPTAPYVPSVSVPITISACAAVDNSITMELTYANMADYRNYNAAQIQKKGGTTIKVGTLGLMDSEVAQMTFTDMDGKTISLGSLVGQWPAHYRYIYCDFECLIYGEGEPVAITDISAYDSKTNSVHVTGGHGVAVIFN